MATDNGSFIWPPLPSSGVTSLNGLTGGLTLVAGSGITITPSGSNLTIAATGAGSGASAALDNLSAVAINTSLLPGVDGTIDLGSASFTWRNIFLDGFAQFETIATPATPASGQNILYGFNENGNANLAILDEVGNSLVLLQDQQGPGFNGTASNLLRGQAVIINGASSGARSYILAQANTSSGSQAYGLVLTSSIAPGVIGEVLIQGRLTNVDTSAFSAGDTLWLSPTIAGGLQNTMPVFPNFATKIGQVLVSSATVGIIALQIIPSVILPIIAAPVNLFFWAVASTDIAGYDQLFTTPNAGAAETIFTSTGSTSKTLMKAFATEPGSPSVVTIPAGTWLATIFAKTSAATGSNLVTIDVFKRATGGAETLLFTVVTPELTGVIVEYDIASVQSAFTLLATDRLVFKASGTSSVAAHTISFYTQGTLHDSFIETPLTAAIGVELQSNKDQPNGYAGLDGSGLLKLSEFPTVDVPHGGTGKVTFNANQVLLAGTTATGNLTQVAGAASGLFLTSTGATTAPTFQSLPTVNANVGSFGSSTSIPSFTVTGTGLITAASGNVVIAPAGTLTGTTLAATVVTSSLTTVGTIATGVWSGTTITTAKGGTGQVSVIVAPAASTYAGWDANKNLNAAGFIPIYTTTVTSAITTTLVVGSNEIQAFTGSTALQVIALPVATTLTNAQSFTILNQSSVAITVKTSGLTTIQVMAPNTQLIVTCINTAGGTGLASWNWQYTSINSTSNAFKAPTVQRFTSSSGTYTTPTAPAPLYIKVTLMGGGGGGSGSGSAVGTPAGNGGNTTFGTSLLTAGGGPGGTFNTTAPVGGTNTVSGGTTLVNVNGASGGIGSSVVAGSGGNGGSSAYGGAGAGGYGSPGVVGSAAVVNSGSGGGGGALSATGGDASGGGSGGFVVSIITSMLATYAYGVGAAGTAGSGTGGSAGGAGGSGLVLVEEFYQ